VQFIQLPLLTLLSYDAGAATDACPPTVLEWYVC
jgi:hypothetical protein